MVCFQFPPKAFFLTADGTPIVPIFQSEEPLLRGKCVRLVLSASSPAMVIDQKLFFVIGFPGLFWNILTVAAMSQKPSCRAHMWREKFLMFRQQSVTFATFAETIMP